MNANKLILIRGGGDLASGVAAVLHRNGWQVVICELSRPLVVRRKVAFAEAVWESEVMVDGIQAVLTSNDEKIERVLLERKIPVIVDPDGRIAERFEFKAVVDARMLKKFQPNSDKEKSLLIGLGPGFIAGENCLAVIETNRGKNLGKVIWQGSAESDTGVPSIVEGRGVERVLYSQNEGIIKTYSEIGDLVVEGQLLAEIGGEAVLSPFDGTLRGMLRDGLCVKAHTKVGDVDPRMDPSLAIRISDKAIIIGQGVLEVMESLS